MPDINDVLDRIQDTRAELGTVDQLVDGISGFLGVGGGGPGNLIDAIRDAILETGFLEDLLKEVAKLIGELADALTQAFGDALATPAIQTALWGTIEGIVDKILDILSGLIGSLAQFPEALRGGAIDALSMVRELGEFLSNCGQLDIVIERILAVEASLNSLFDLITGGSGLGSTLFGQFFGSLNTILRAVIETSDDLATVIFDAIKDVVFPKELILAVLRKMSEQKLWAWGTLPSGLFAGQLNTWLNDPSSYGVLGGGASVEKEKKHRDTQREFRVRMIAAADSYLRRQVGDAKSPLTAADERVSPEAIADVIIIFVEKTIGFSLEPECYPEIDFDWDGIEDIGFRFAATLGKQIRLIVRSTTGILLRGIWEFSIQSYALIEMIGAIIGSIASAFIEGCVRNVAFSVQIISRYHDSPVGSASIALKWFSLETIEDSGVDSDRLEYVALLRMPCNGTLTIPSRIEGLIKDIGAYIDATYRQVKVENKFVNQQTVDRVTITRAELIGDRMTIWATTSKAFEMPQPILRAYFCCEIMAMRPGASPSDPYTVDIDVTKVPRCRDVHVLSNRGGSTRRKLAII